MTTIGTISLSLAEGLALILSPCILPVLPLVLGASLDGSKARPLGIVVGFAAAFTAFALISRQAVLASGIGPEAIRNASLVMLMVFGLVMLFPRLSDKWSTWFGKLGGNGDALISRIKGQGFWGGVGIGCLIGIVWTPCAGPIIAAAILQIIQADTDAAALASIAAFSFGAAIPMFIIAISGRYIMSRLGFLKKHSYAIRRVFGIIMIAAALSIYTGLDLKFIAWRAQAEAAENTTTTTLEDTLPAPVPAPEITGITDWINSNPLTMAQLKGKIVLIDFWTYSCINCIRTLPYVTKWYDTYKDDGLVVIGVHAPEFPFEKKLSNVKDAVAEHKINYPVALDNNFGTWQAFKNQYWPAHYLIDREGRIVYTHFGEGRYDVTENNIRKLLSVDKKSETPPEKEVTTANQSPETYLGYDRAQNFVSDVAVKPDAAQTYAFPVNLDRDEWALEGPWTIGAQKITGGEGAALRYNFSGYKVFLVLGTVDGKPIDVTITVNSKNPKTMTVTDEKLYTLVDTETPKGLLEIKAKRAGLEAYAFTFGK